MHAEVNQLMRDYAGMGDTLNKHKLVFQALCRKHCPAIPAFDPPRRLCLVCEEPLAHNKDIHTACQLINPLLCRAVKIELFRTTPDSGGCRVVLGVL
jgi:hypothetical protein